MYGFPKEEELSGIIGKNLTMICCNANQVNLHFDSQNSISIDAGQFQINSGHGIITTKVPIDNLAIFSLLEKRVNTIHVNEARSNLEISFENHWKIVLSDDEGYESHRITFGKKEYVV